MAPICAKREWPFTASLCFCAKAMRAALTGMTSASRSRTWTPGPCYCGRSYKVCRHNESIATRIYGPDCRRGRACGSSREEAQHSLRHSGRYRSTDGVLRRTSCCNAAPRPFRRGRRAFYQRVRHGSCVFGKPLGADDGLLSKQDRGASAQDLVVEQEDLAESGAACERVVPRCGLLHLQSATAGR